MEENTTELEEGEACYEEVNINPDIALSYIDEKIQHVLGHFQKDFEGGVSAENLGAKFGGYGSFLPTYERSSSIRSHPKTPQKNYSTPSSPNNLPNEYSKAPPNVPASSRLGAASYDIHSLHNSRAPSGDMSVKKYSCLSSAQGTENIPLKADILNKSGNLIEKRKRTLKVRIKVGSDMSVQKNAAIYSGLGLDNSPSSSLGNSHEGSGGIQSISQETMDEFPTNILKVMTSFPVPGDVLISPLHESMLHLIKKERPLRDSKHVPSLKGSQEESVMLGHEPVSLMGNGKVLKEKKTKIVGKSERMIDLNHGNGNDTTFPMKIKLENDTPEGKNFLLNGLKRTSPSNPVSDGDDYVKVTGWASEVSMGADKDAVKKRLFSSDSVKEDSFELITGQENGKNDKKYTGGSLVEKVWEHRITDSGNDVLVDRRDNGRCKDNKTSAPLEAYSGLSKSKEDLNVGAIAPPEKVSQKAKFHEQDESNMPYEKEEPSFEAKKKLKGIQRNGRPASVSTKERLRIGVGAAPKDKKSTIFDASSCKSKTRKSQKATDKVRDNHRDSLGDKKLELTDNCMDPERLSGYRPKGSNIDDVEIAQNPFLNESKERLSGIKVDNQWMSGASVRDAPTVNPPTMETGLSSEIVPAVVAPVVIEENWVCCDKCQKWRLLPFGTKPEQLPEKWLCSMLCWLPGMNRCDISEEDTTKALNALYQVPGSESQNKLQNHNNEILSGVTSADALHFGQNQQNSTSQSMPLRGKKKHGPDELLNASSRSGTIKTLNSTKNLKQESVRRRSLNEMTQPPAESNPMKKSSFQHLSMLHNLMAEKQIPKQTEKHTIGDDAKQRKMKSKRGAELYGHGTLKRSKTDDLILVDEHQNSVTVPGKGSFASSTGLPSNASGKHKQQHGEHYKEDRNCDAKDRLLVSAKKLGDQAQVSADGRPVDLRTDKKDSSVKKRNLKDWQGNQNNVETFQHSGHGGKIYRGGSSESGFRKEKERRTSKTEGEESGINVVNERSNEKGRVTQIFSSGSRDHQVDDMGEVRSINKEDPYLRKQRRKVVSQQTLDGVESLRRDLGSGQFSVAATSSSSKISGSRKSRANFEDSKGSPVESVSSSPFRISNPGNPTSVREDFLRKDGAVNGGLPVMGNSISCWDAEGSGEIHGFGSARKEKDSCDFLPDSLKFSTPDYWDGDANHKLSGKAKSNRHFLIGDADSMEQHGRFPSDTDRMNENHSKDALFQKKSSKGSPLRSKYKDRRSTRDSDRDKMKVFDPVSGQEELHSKKSLRYEPDIDPDHCAPCHEIMNDVKHSFPGKCRINSSNTEKNLVNGRDSVGQGSSNCRIENQLKPKMHDGPDLKLGGLCSTNGKADPEQNLIQDCGGENIFNWVADNNKADPIHIESRNGKSKLFSHCESEGIQKPLTHTFRPAPGSHKFDGLPIDGFGNGDISKTSKQHGNVGSQNGVPLGHLTCGVRDQNASPATSTLKEAKDIQAYADRLKSSGFGFESNEAYFKAALKFFYGASHLDNSEIGKHGEMSQMQAYSTAAKLCEFCAHEYERRQEMAAASLAYKCMEVAYMRVVYSKYSSTNRDWQELQATLHMVPQGESPSSSASDIDNLNNNQATMDKATLSKSIGLHIGGSHVIVARNRPNYVRLLDFIQDVNFAIEASRKSQIAFAAANVSLEGAQNSDCITSLKRVIDFSFQDIEGLMDLVQDAMKAINRSDFGGARD